MKNLTILFSFIAIMILAPASSFAVTGFKPIPANFQGKIIYKGNFSDNTGAGSLAITLAFDGNAVKGSYVVTTPGQNGSAPLTGTRDGEQCNLREDNAYAGVLWWHVNCDEDALNGTYVSEKGAAQQYRGNVTTTASSLVSYNVNASGRSTESGSKTVYQFSPWMIVDYDQESLIADMTAKSPEVQLFSQWLGKSPLEIIGGKNFFEASGVPPKEMQAQLIKAKLDYQKFHWSPVAGRVYSGSGIEYITGLCNTLHKSCPEQINESAEGAFLHLVVPKSERRATTYETSYLWFSNTDLDTSTSGNFTRYCKTDPNLLYCFPPTARTLSLGDNITKLRLKSKDDYAYASNVIIEIYDDGKDPSVLKKQDEELGAIMGNIANHMTDKPAASKHSCALDGLPCQGQHVDSYGNTVNNR